MSRHPFLAMIVAMASLLMALPLGADQWQTGTYTYDLSGSITAIGNHTFVYDAAGRLRSGTYGPMQQQEYTYDDFGNILTIITQGAAVVSTLAANPANNRLDLPGATFNVFAGYDDRGNMTSYLGTETFTYDGLGVMTTSKSPMGVETFHVYGADDERVGVIAVNGSTVVSANWTFRDLSGKVLRTIDETASGTLVWEKDYLYRGDLLLAAAVPTSDKVLQYHLDHLGTPRLVTSNGGVTVAASTYYPFGKEATATATDTGTLKFTGHERDLPTLDYLHARFYDPHLGRFLSVDPGNDVDLTQPQSWNKFSYVRNDPVNLIDPTGMTAATFEATTWVSAQPLALTALGWFLSGRSNAHQLDQWWQSVRKKDAELTAGLAGISRYMGGNCGGDAACADQLLSMLGYYGIAGGGGRAASALPDVAAVLKNPNLLNALSSAQLRLFMFRLQQNGWRLGTLGKGSHKGMGMIIRETDATGKLTGRMIQYHPGGGHHGAQAYWKASSPAHGTIRHGASGSW